MKKHFLFLIAILLSTHCFAQLKQYNITAYGAVANSDKVCTKALQAAIDDCNSNGGGDVVIPAGVFIIGTASLKSNVNLYLQKGAVLRGSSNLDDYTPYTPDTPYQHIHLGMFFTRDAENVSITGEGQLDGNGDSYFELDKAKKLDTSVTKYSRQGAK